MVSKPRFSKIRKRDGTLVRFDEKRIEIAIRKAIQATNETSEKNAAKIASKVASQFAKNFGTSSLSVEDIQDQAERVLMAEGLAETAKAYIIYRQKRKEVREAKSLLGVEDDVKLSYNAVKVLERRYLRKDETGTVVETPGEMFKRIAENIASADLIYDADADVKRTAKKFYDMMVTAEFMPNSPTLMNAGTEIQQLSACFVLPVEDKMESIFDAIKNTALIHQSGGGTGFSFSRLRPKGDVVKSTGGVASGPISFMKVFNASTEVVKQGGKRRGANMGILRVDHPDIIEFITAKEDQSVLTNFNISVGLTEEFMQAVEDGGEYDLVSPRSGERVKSLNAQEVFNLIVLMSWKSGEPGVIFIDRLNRDNPTPQLGDIESTNPCGEQPLLPYEACNLGSINLSKMVSDGEVNWRKLRKTVHNAVHFLDNVIDMSKFPLKKIERMVKKTRKIGLGVMGFADLLIQLRVPYNSKEGIELGRKVMAFVNDESKKKSEEIASRRGTFPAYPGSIYDKPDGMRLRNATTTTIAPTGTISMIANCSSGVEPLFAISYIRNIMDNTELIEVNPLFEKVARSRGFYTEELMRRIAGRGTIHGLDEIPEDVERVFVTAHDISPDWHLRMQAAFQDNTDNAVSKTVNFPSTATPQEVEEVFMLSYQLGCKGVTIYRDKSRDSQVLNIGEVNRQEKEKTRREGAKAESKSGAQVKKEGVCPECSSKLSFTEGCATCMSCGYSVCSVS